MRKYKSIWWICLIGFAVLMPLLILSCQKWRIDSVEVVNYQPDISVPIGTYNMSVNDLTTEADLPVVDSADVGKFQDLILYDNQYYQSPVRFDTIIRANFTFNKFNTFQPNVRQIVFRTNLKNYSHTSVEYQIYFYDDVSGQPFDSLYSNGPINFDAGTVNSDNTITGTESFRNDVVIDQNRLDHFFAVSHIEIAFSFVFNHIENQYVWYQSDQLLWLQLAARIGLNIDANK